MADKKKKGKEPKQPKVPPPKEYTLITLAEVKTRERNQNDRLRTLRECRSDVSDAKSELFAANTTKSIQEKWDDYMICDGIPTKPFLPPDVRTFLAKMYHFEKESMEKTIDWLMGVDERSILTQNIYRIDRTRRVLVDDLKPEFGHEYEDRVNKALQVLTGLEYYLETEQYGPRPAAQVLEDMRGQQFAIQAEIKNYFNRYTYRIICSPEAYMNEVDAITTEYVFNAQHFAIHIWTVKNVPIRFEYMEDPRLIADLHAINVILRIPFNVLQPNLTVRALRLDFDHYTFQAKSFNLPKTNTMTVDLIERLKQEWEMQVRMQQNQRNLMKDKRAEYEEIMRAIEEEEARKAKEKGKSDKPAGKPIKAPKEPPIITDNTYPDIFEDFLMEEQQQFELEREMLFNPDILQVQPKEINLRQYFILGGVYLLQFVDKPPHLDFFGYNMTWHEHHGDLFINNEVRAKRKRNTAKSRRTLRMSAASPAGKIAAVTEADEQWTDDTSPFFVITFELPRNLCLWGPPLVCQHEHHTIYVDVEQNTGMALGTGLATTMPSTAGTGLLTTPGLPLAETASALKAELIGDSASAVVAAATVASTPAPADDPIPTADFQLDASLTKAQIRQLQRHCLPRILSSFKFPGELRDEADEVNRNKPKGQGGTLVRRRADDAGGGERGGGGEDVLTFNYSLQSNPERLFAQFPLPEPLILYEKELLLEHYAHDTNEPNSVSALMHVLDGVKAEYLDEPQRIPRQPRFKMVVPKVKKKPKHDHEAVVEERHGARLTAKSISGRSSRRFTQDTSKRQSTRSNASVGSGTSRHASDSHLDVEGAELQGPKKAVTYTRWSRECILHTTFDSKNSKMTIWTDRLGVFGFALKSYEQFPFREWSVQPSEENPKTEIEFKLETFRAQCVLYITKDGYRGHVTEATKKFVRNRAMYVVIKEPTKDFKNIKRLFREANVNIFPEPDASYYIENGPFVEKQPACEMHTYACMSLHSTHLQFQHTPWNGVLPRRNLILRIKALGEKDEPMLIRITPEESTFVDIEETNTVAAGRQIKCTPTALNYAPYADLHQLINSLSSLGVEPPCVKDPNLIIFLQQLLCSVRPLSFSLTQPLEEFAPPAPPITGKR